MNKNSDTNNFGFNDEEVKQISKRVQLIQPLLDEQLSPEEKRDMRKTACDELGVSRRTLRRYLKNLKKSGLRGLRRKPRKDQGTYRIVSPELRQKTIELLEQSPWRSIPTVKKLLLADEKWGSIVSGVSLSALYRVASDAGYALKHRNKKLAQKVYHRFESPHALYLVQGDARHGSFLPHPDGKGKQAKRTYLFAWVDDFSRKILFAKYYWDEKLPRLEDALRQMVLRWGIPLRAYCDNGSVYVSNNFAFQLDALLIKLIHHPPYKAWCKGKVESVMKILKAFQREIEMAHILTIEALNETLAAWVEIEYNQKVHSETGETPNSRFRNSIAKHQPRRVKDMDWFNALFLSREPRVIDKFKRIRFNTNEYRIDGLPIGEHVEIRYNPFDLSEIQVFHDKKYYCNLKAYKLTCKEKRDIPEETKKSNAVVSKESQVYFSKLRAKYLEQKRRGAESTYFSDIPDKNKE